MPRRGVRTRVLLGAAQSLRSNSSAQAGSLPYEGNGGAGRRSGFCAWGCVNFASAPAHAAPPHSEIYQRATNEFACAEYYKPVETKTNEPSFTLAPLILQQFNGAQELSLMPDGFGTLTVSNGSPVLDQSRPTIYWDADTVQVNGRAHARFSYVWCYPLVPASRRLGNAPRTCPRTEPKLVCQCRASGSRLTPPANR